MAKEVMGGHIDAVLRALIVLGLARAGIAVDSLKPDALRLLAVELSPEIKRALGELYTERSTGRVQMYAERSTAAEVPYLPTQTVQTVIADAEEAPNSPLDVGLEF